MDKLKLEECKIEIEKTKKSREEIPGIVDYLVRSCNTDDCFDHVELEPLPSKESIIDITHMACRILYPGYFSRTRIDKVNLIYYFGQEVTAFFEALSEQIAFSIRHECRRYNLPCVNCEEQGQERAINLMKELPRLRTLLAKDIRCAYE
ncbi:MAG: serine acetyltransferase, partial [Nitrospirota bacterium]|nr:serine acetyltransferase [Nitrospirota bacterium]